MDVNDLWGAIVRCLELALGRGRDFLAKIVPRAIPGDREKGG